MKFNVCSITVLADHVHGPGQSPGRDLNPGFPQHERVLNIRLRRSAKFRYGN